MTLTPTLPPLIAGNWKMNGRADWAGKADALVKLTDGLDGVELLLCPSHPYVAALAGQGVAIGGQDCHAESAGAHTGEVAAEMLADVGASYVIVGHSERRASGETDAEVKAKAEAAHRAGLTPIVCVGESLEQREAGSATDVVLGQIKGSLPDSVGETVIAYEPVWAIGTGKVATPADIANMHAAIRAEVGKLRILYGGSVKPANAADVLGTANVDGALVGGASLDMESFAAIAEEAAKIVAGSKGVAGCKGVAG